MSVGEVFAYSAKVEREEGEYPVDQNACDANYDCSSTVSAVSAAEHGREEKRVADEVENCG